MKSLVPVAALVGLGVFLMGRQKPAPSTARRSKAGVDSDLSHLAPHFRRKIEQLLKLMRDYGFRPIVWETYRTPERAKALTPKLKGASMHTLGLAVDIVDEDLLWDATPAFRQALQRTAESLGLTSGATFSDPDDWHVQGVPLKLQAKVRAMPTLAQRDALLQQLYA